MEFRILGPLQVIAAGEELPLGGPKQRALLALLLLNPGQVVSTDRLIDELWKGKPPPTAATALHGYVSQLRKLLERGHTPGSPRCEVVTGANGYALAVEPGQIDGQRFESLLEQGRQELADGRESSAALTLREALELWRGEALADVADEPFARASAAALEDLRLAALEERIEADLALGRHAELVGELQALAAMHPLRERPRGQLMVALYRSGRQAEALEVFQEARRTLVADLGLEPSPFLQQLERSILNQDPGLGLPPARGRAATTALPAPRNPIVGRDRELSELCELTLQPDVRLVTLIGVGGAGKSRLALEVATVLDHAFEAGSCFVQLAPVTDPELVLAAVARKLAVGEVAGESLPETCARELSARQLLVVLDNFEQVVAAAPDIADLLARVPGVTVLATSRIALRLSNEHLYPVPPLLRDDSVTLLAERLRSVRPDFVLTAESAATLTEICARLDDLPLALELAAARGLLLSPEAILERLQHRLELLTAGARDLPERQRSLRAAMDWSFDLLEPPERRLLANLSVFAGGCSVGAVEAVGAAGSGTLDALSALVEHSLVQATEGAQHEARVTMLETIREYAAERLEATGEAEAVRRRHAELFCALAENAAADLGAGQRQAVWLERLELEHANMRAALAWCSGAGAHELVARLAAALTPFWAMHGYLTEGRRWLDEALAAQDQAPKLRAQVLAGASLLALIEGDSGAALSLAEEQLAANRDVGDQREIAHSLSHLASVVADEGDLVRARSLFEESRELSLAEGDERGVARAIVNLGNLALITEEFERAATLCEESLALMRELGDEEGIAISLYNLGSAELHRDHREHARAAFEESLLRSHALGAKELIAYCLEGLARGLAQERNAERAARLLGAAERVREETGALHQPHERPGYEQAVALVRAAVDEIALATAWREGRELSLELAIEEARLQASAEAH